MKSSSYQDHQQAGARLQSLQFPRASWDVVLGRVLAIIFLLAMSILFWWALSILVATVARAEFYVAGDALQSNCARPAVDGTWKQDLITGGSDFGCGNVGWDAGLGYRFGDGPRLLSDNWSIELGYRDYGTATAGGRWVSDDHYTEVMHHGEQWLEDNGVVRRNVAVTDDVHGGYVRVAKGFLIGPVEPYVSVGWFGGVHTLRHANKANRVLFTGMVAGPTAGLGLKFNVWRGIKMRVGADLFQAMIESDHPISSRWWTVGGGLEVPFPWSWR